MPDQDIVSAESIDNIMERMCPAETIVLGLINEATFYGDGASHSARVSAWGQLAKIAKIAVDKTEVTDNSSKIAIVNVTVRKVPKKGELQQIEDAILS